MRMTGPTMDVLRAFLEARQPLAGADLINDFRMFSGTLYPILRRLQDQGWIVGHWEAGDPKVLGRPRRKFYELTAIGQRAANEALAARNLRFARIGPAVPIPSFAEG